MVFRNPLELQYWFVNVFSGSTLLFTIISIITIASMAAYFRMSNSTTMIFLAIFGIMMSSFIGGWIIVPVIVIGGILTFHAMSKLWE